MLLLLHLKDATTMLATFLRCKGYKDILRHT